MEKIREKSKKFKDKAAVLHWDGKLLPALTGKEKVDRLLSKQSLGRQRVQMFRSSRNFKIPGVPPRGVSFRVPGAMHQARWMAKALYILKIFFFRNVYPLSSSDLKSCREICIFLVKFYIKIWFNAPHAAKAPQEDLQMLKSIHLFEKQDREISTAVFEKLSLHLWYLVPETAALAFFDDEIPSVRKNLMVQALSQESKKPIMDYKRNQAKKCMELVDKEIEYFISKDSMKFFSAFQIETSFLEEDASHWMGNAAYEKGKKIVSQLKVVNDVAERGVKLMSDFNDLKTRDEDQKQFLLHVAREYREKFPDINKSTLSRDA